MTANALPLHIKRLEALETLGIKFGLENIRRLLAALGNPERRYPSILIAGTNGKGSVGAMLEAILVKNGFQTGYYLSPHLVDVRERIRVNRDKISDDSFRETLAKIFQIIDELQISPTYFETLTATGLFHFAEAHMNCAVIEVGLGGRFDATNAISQSLSIITSIGLDHEAFLGKTLESIATEKAMIAKPGVPMVIGSLPSEARNTIKDVCRRTGSEVHVAEPSNMVERRIENGFPVFEYRPWHQKIRISLRGQHQIENAGVALTAVQQLQEIGWKFNQERTVHALNEVRWPGRLELVPGFEPSFLLDCAHNPMGVHALIQYLEDMKWPKSVFLFTAMKDKNFEEMLRLIVPHGGAITLCRVEPFDRCATIEELSMAASSAGIRWQSEADPDRALDQALALSKQLNLPLVAFGSIYLIGHLFSRLGLVT